MKSNIFNLNFHKNLYSAKSIQVTVEYFKSEFGEEIYFSVVPVKNHTVVKIKFITKGISSNEIVGEFLNHALFLNIK